MWQLAKLKIMLQNFGTALSREQMKMVVGGDAGTVCGCDVNYNCICGSTRTCVAGNTSGYIVCNGTPQYPIVIK